MREILVASMKSYTIAWNHLDASLNFDGLRNLLGIDCHKLRNVHDLEIFRSEGGIFCRWKQYMSDEIWSRPRLLVLPEQIPVVARAVPETLKHAFSDSMKSKYDDFLNKFELLLASTNILGEQEKEGMKWLRRATSTDTGYEIPVQKIIEDIEMANGSSADNIFSSVFCVSLSCMNLLCLD